jgi:hypothetical protein
VCFPTSMASNFVNNLSSSAAQHMGPRDAPVPPVTAHVTFSSEKMLGATTPQMICPLCSLVNSLQGHTMTRWQ